MYKFEIEKGIQKGLAAWFIFLIIFWALRFPAVLCILLGAIAGLAVFAFNAYWLAEELPTDNKPKEEESASPIRPVNRLFENIRRPILSNRLAAPLKGRARKRIGGKQ